MTSPPASPSEPRPYETSSLDLWLDLPNGSSRSLEYFQSLRALLVRRLGAHPSFAALASRLDPEDIVQEVWTRALRPGALDGFEYRGKGSLRAYLLRVLDCTVTDHVRRHGAQKRGAGVPHVPLGMRPDEHTPPFEVPSPDPTPTQVARTHELADRFEQSLEEPARTMWHLAEHDGLSYEDIARRLGVTSAVVRGVLHRARRRFEVNGDQHGESATTR